MYFLLYYLFTEEDSDFMRQVTVAVPFNEENTATLLNEFRRIVRTTLTASGAVALAQGGVLTIAFLFFNIQGAFLWGAIAAVLSFLPLVGAAFVWIPAVIVQFFQADYAAAIGILAAGLFISVLDNFLRPMVQKTVGKIHPLLSLLGIVIGVPLRADRNCYRSPPALLLYSDRTDVFQGVSFLKRVKMCRLTCRRKKINKAPFYSKCSYKKNFYSFKHREKYAD